MHNLRIAYLADHPEALPALERLFQIEWADYYGPAGPGDARQDPAKHAPFHPLETKPAPAHPMAQFDG